MNAEEPERLVGADRVLAALIELAEHPAGISLDELATRLGSSKPTAHRALAVLRRAGFASLEGRGRYELGDEFVRLAYRFADSRPESAAVMPLLQELATRFGETVHFAVLDGRDIVYRAKVDPPSGAMRLTSTIGGRNPARSTAVGKLLLSAEVSTAVELDQWFDAVELAAITPTTITTIDGLWQDLELTKERGYGLDNQENEIGVNCIALPVRIGGVRAGGISLSGLTYRCDLDSLVEAVPAIREMIERHLGAGATRMTD